MILIQSALTLTPKFFAPSMGRVGKKGDQERTETFSHLEPYLTQMVVMVALAQWEIQDLQLIFLQCIGKKNFSKQQG